MTHQYHLAVNFLWINPYHGCVAYKMVKGKQITICFHVDDCKISHESSKVIDETIEWLREEYESIFEDGSGAMKVHRGKVHKYLGITLDFSHKGKCRVSMYDYVDDILEAFDDAINSLTTNVVLAGTKKRPQNTRIPTMVSFRCL